MVQTAVTEPRIARLTAEQVHAMLAAGILSEAEPIELIGGVLVYKDRSAFGEDPRTIGPRHNIAVQLLAALTTDLAPRGWFVQTQGPLLLPPHDEPEPDGAVLRGSPRDYAQGLATAADVACVFEVADSSLAYDRTTKLALYARAGISQYLIVNLREDVVEVHEAPSPGAGIYDRRLVVGRDGTVALRVGGAVVDVAVSRFLP